MPVTAPQVNIARAIREAFDQLRFSYRSGGGRRVWVPWQKDPLEGATGWTTAVNTTLCRIGREHFGMEVRAGKDKVMPGTHLDHGEWLWDITWRKENDKSQMVDMSLVAECEFSKMTVAGIVEDFQKLLVARADVRLMIHEHFTDEILNDDDSPAEEKHRAPAMANHLAQHVQAFGYTQSDDVYLLIALDGHERPYENHRIRYFRLNMDGTADEWVKGEPLPST